MSRIGKLPVKIPSGVKASVADNNVSVEGPKGKVAHSFDKNAIKIVLEGDENSRQPGYRLAFLRRNVRHGKKHYRGNGKRRRRGLL